MDQRRVVWNATNTKHIERDHSDRSIVRAEVEEVLNDPDRVEVVIEKRGVMYHEAAGLTHSGRLLIVAWVDHSDGRFPVHARRGGRRAARRYYR